LLTVVVEARFAHPFQEAGKVQPDDGRINERIAGWKIAKKQIGTALLAATMLVSLDSARPTVERDGNHPGASQARRRLCARRAPPTREPGGYT
jgi:hypothetical protein